MKLTPNEIELLRIIRDNEDPERALMIAFRIIIDFLAQTERTEV